MCISVVIVLRLILLPGKISEEYGGVFALPSVAEKGYIDVRLEVTSPGGHSSVPPSHTVGYFVASVIEHKN